MTWNVSMQGESDRQPIYKEGPHEAEVLTVSLVTAEQAKSGNPYFKWNLRMAEGDIQTITTLMRGKRWLLKQMLSACGVNAKENDPTKKYSFEEKDVVGQKVIIHIVNRPNTFTGRNGNQITIEKSEVNRVEKMTTEALLQAPKEKKEANQPPDDEVPY